MNKWIFWLLIGAAYLLVAGVMYYVGYQGHQKCVIDNGWNMEHGTFAFLVAAIWPLTLWFLVPWLIAKRKEN